jgi:hypothetical protein
MTSSTGGSKWYFTVVGAGPVVRNAQIKDSSAVAGNQINARTGCTDLGNNVNWDFGNAPATPTPTPSPSVVPSPSPSVEPSPEASAEVSPQPSIIPFAPSPASSPSLVPSVTTTSSAYLNLSTISPTSSLSQTAIGDSLLTDPEVSTGAAIVLVASGKAVKVSQNDEVKMYDNTPEFKGVTTPNAFVDALITGRVTVSERTTADEVGNWFVGVKDKLPTGKYMLSLDFKENGKTLGSKSFRFEIARNYWLDALYISILLAILVALVILIKKINLKKSASSKSH